MVLLTPGPTPVPREVREAMARPIIHHRTPEYEALQGRCDAMLRRVFRTRGPVLTIVGSGTAAFESAQLSLVRPGDTVIACSCGRFGARWQATFDRQAARLGLRVVKVDAEWGAPVSVERVGEALGANPGASLVTLVHCETSTTTLSDLRGIAGVVRARAPGALLLVDAVSSLGAVPLEMDAWGVDAVAAGSQKALMLSPGLGFVGLGERAVERMRTTAEGDVVAPMYMDLREHLKGYEKRSPPFTPAVSLMYGLEAALMMIDGEGIERVWARTAARARGAREALVAMGLRLASSAPSDSLTGVFYPEGVGDEVRELCGSEFGAHLAGGQEAWKGKMLRMSHMGAVTEADTAAGVAAIGGALERLGRPGGVDPEAGMRVIRAHFAAATE